jgi:hypothetical protein
MTRLFAFFAALTGLATTATAQRLAHHDLLLLPLTKTAAGAWQTGTPQFLTAFNRQGYNNQPCFFSPTEIYLTVQMPDDTTQTDIIALDLATRTQTRITATRPEAEYSPTPMPDGRHFSTVRVEADGRQRLWQLPLDRSGTGQPVFPNLYGVGYHCWVRDTVAALFIVGEAPEPHTLVLAGLRGQRPLRIASAIGRCLQKMPNGRLAFVQKATEQTWFIKAFDLNKQSTEVLTKTLPGCEDFVVLPDGTLLSSCQTKLYQFRPGMTDWQQIADLSPYGVRRITRLAVRDSRLVVVVD